MKITIIGAGNTAVAAACFLKTLGLSSLIYTRREERAKQWNQFPVKASGACTGSFSLESTTDLKTAVHYGDILLVCTLAADHETVVSEIAPHLQAHQSILFFNGCWGALKAYRALSKRQDIPPLTIGETANMPFMRTDLKSSSKESKKKSLTPLPVMIKPSAPSFIALRRG